MRRHIIYINQTIGFNANETKAKHICGRTQFHSERILIQKKNRIKRRQQQRPTATDNRSMTKLLKCFIPVRCLSSVTIGMMQEKKKTRV